MLPLPAFKLHRPRTMEEATTLLAQLGDRARLVAGGTDIVPNMKHGLVDAKALVSLQQVDALHRVELRLRRTSIDALRIAVSELAKRLICFDRLLSEFHVSRGRGICVVLGFSSLGDLRQAHA